MPAHTWIFDVACESILHWECDGVHFFRVQVNSLFQTLQTGVHCKHKHTVQCTSVTAIHSSIRPRDRLAMTECRTRGEAASRWGPHPANADQPAGTTMPHLLVTTPRPSHHWFASHQQHLPRATSRLPILQQVPAAPTPRLESSHPPNWVDSPIFQEPPGP